MVLPLLLRCGSLASGEEQEKRRRANARLASCKAAPIYVKASTSLCVHGDQIRFLNARRRLVPWPWLRCRALRSPRTTSRRFPARWPSSSSWRLGAVSPCPDTTMWPPEGSQKSIAPGAQAAWSTTIMGTSLCGVQQSLPILRMGPAQVKRCCFSSCFNNTDYFRPGV